ncbi:MAG: cobalt-precorrin-5B (C(1))-methyltransferase CbiD [Methanobrevibacter sp.]|nr:cobalt-precorrin-5B (C(1))-methyltransferase CbiD [Methanobrevibacter sp.]
MNNNNFKEFQRPYGLTTGTLATAASLASLKKILNPNENQDFVEVKSPFDEIQVEIESCDLIDENIAKSSAIKYPYNDPDVTVNLAIVSSVELIDNNGSENLINNKNSKKLINNANTKDNIIIEGSSGVGIITKPGLQIPVGKPAINPVPLVMIEENLKNLVPKGKIAKITISAPDGEKVAKKTMNPKLGIIGGISILGTTGIARAMSNKAYKDSLLCQLDIAIAMVGEGIFDKSSLVFVPGNIGENLALKNLDIEKDQIIQMGNYIGFMFEEAKKRGINNFALFGHIGKLVKVAGGIFNTKHSVGDGRREIIATHAGLCGAERETIQAIFNSKTTEEMINILREINIDEEVLNSIASNIKKRCLERFDLDINVILVDMDGNQLNSEI